MLVGSTDVTDLNTVRLRTIENPSPIQVLAGDLIGFTFLERNPIPYDHTFYCSRLEMIRFRPAHSTNVGETYSFAVKSDEHLLCRIYSLYAEVIVASKIYILSCNQFALVHKCVPTWFSISIPADNGDSSYFGFQLHSLHSLDTTYH